LTAFAPFHDASAQTTVEVNDGQTLLIADLLNGSFQGMNFVLGPTTTFEINNGGRLGAIGSTAPYGTLDFQDSTVDINEGGIFGLCINPECGRVENLKLNVYDGGRAFPTLQTGNGTVVNIYGGSLGNTILEAGSVVNIHGGNVGLSLLSARPGSELNISAGLFRNFDAQTGSAVTLIGGEFRLNGSAYTNPTVSLMPGDVFTGTLSDGSVFIIDPSTNLSYSNIMLETVSLPDISPTSFIIDGTEPSVPRNLRNGQSLTLLPGGELNEQFYVQGASIDVQGGQLGWYTRVVETAVTISGGEVGNRFEAYHGSAITVTGGNFPYETWARKGSTWDIHEGSLNEFTAWDGSEVHLFGGSVDRLTTLPGSAVDIHGATINGILAYGGTLNLFVKSASVNGVPLELGLGVPVEISERGFSSSLEAILADESPISIDLAPDQGKPPSPFVHPSANLFVTLVPEPQALHLMALSIALAVLCCRRGRSLNAVLSCG
jgi:hypothetical protein